MTTQALLLVLAILLPLLIGETTALVMRHRAGRRAGRPTRRQARAASRAAWDDHRRHGGQR